MSDYPLRVRLTGIKIEFSDDAASHKMMSSRGFQKHVVHPASKFVSAL
jgi:hypothetical protein